MLGFGGHWSTKSRRHSTTMTILRRARVTFAKRRRAKDGVPLDAWGRPEDDQAVIVVASWVYVASGYRSSDLRFRRLVTLLPLLSVVAVGCGPSTDHGERVLVTRLGDDDSAAPVSPGR